MAPQLLQPARVAILRQAELALDALKFAVAAVRLQ